MSEWTPPWATEKQDAGWKPPWQKTGPDQPDELTWGEVGEGVVNNFGSNAAEYGGAIADMAMNPIDSFMAITKFLGGGLQEALPESLVQTLGEDKEGREMFNGFIDSVKNDYGSMEGFKRALAERPVETMSDLSIVFNAAGLGKKIASSAVNTAAMPAAAQKAAGAVGKAVDMGKYLDPIEAAVGATKGATGLLGGVAQLPSGVGGPALKEAFASGAEGGARAEDFRRGMRSPEATYDEAVGRVKQQLSGMRKERGDAYKAGMAEVGKASEPVTFDAIDQALKDAAERTVYEGEVIDKAAAKSLSQAKEAVDKWKGLDPAKFHTAEGMDKLKQAIGAIQDKKQYGTNARHVLDNPYHTVKNAITEQAPVYAETMRNYTDASELMRQLEKTMSAGKNALDDTTLRKLQSVMRDGVNTNFGARAKMAEEGAKFGPDYRPLVAGQSMSSWAPTGLARQGAFPAAGVLGSYLNPALIPAAVASAAASSPRLVGEAAHAAGRSVGRGGKKAMKVADKAPEAVKGLLESIADPVLANILYQTLYAQGEQE
jgi:hypothetical protein